MVWGALGRVEPVLIVGGWRQKSWQSFSNGALHSSASRPRNLARVLVSISFFVSP